MQIEERQFEVSRLVEHWRSASIQRNPEYQRGETWNTQQKQCLVDSILRGYPIPTLFFEEVSGKGLDGTRSKRFEVVDGQQRLIALADYIGDKFELLEAQDRRLRLPLSLRSTHINWGKRRFSDLDRSDQDKLLGTKLRVVILSNVDNHDNIRDLFIRLQSGTALTRQQVRDAWPGNLGPFVEYVAGKLDKEPRYPVFQFVDGRGLRDDDGDTRDPFVKHRTTCAQVFAILLGRMIDPLKVPSLGANHIDALYHEYTDFDTEGHIAQQLKDVLKHCFLTCQELGQLVAGKRKISKACMFALAMFFQDMLRSPQTRFSNNDYKSLVGFITESAPKPPTKSTQGSSIRQYYEDWRAAMGSIMSIRIDSRDQFSPDERAELFERQGRRCAICSLSLDSPNVEAEHFPVAHRDGGPTTVENGRLLCFVCRPRGRAFYLDDGNEAT